MIFGHDPLEPLRQSLDEFNKNLISGALETIRENNKVFVDSAMLLIKANDTAMSELLKFSSEQTLLMMKAHGDSINDMIALMMQSKEWSDPVPESLIPKIEMLIKSTANIAPFSAESEITANMQVRTPFQSQSTNSKKLTWGDAINIFAVMLNIIFFWLNVHLSNVNNQEPMAEARKQTALLEEIAENTKPKEEVESGVDREYQPSDFIAAMIEYIESLNFDYEDPSQPD